MFAEFHRHQFSEDVCDFYAAFSTGACSCNVSKGKSKTVRSDNELIRACLEHDKAAFADLIRRYEKVVFATAVSILGDRHSAEDVVQNAFVAAYENLPSLRKSEAFGPWLVQIARRNALRESKRRRKLMSLEKDVVAPCVNGQPSEASLYLLKGLERLPKHERMVVMLRYFENLSVDSIALSTGRPVGTVTKQLTRARTRLLNWMKGFRNEND